MLDRFNEEGCSLFSRSSSTLLVSSSSRSSASAEYTVFTPEGEVHRSARPITATDNANADATGADETLWRACIRLNMLPRWRMEGIERDVLALDSLGSGGNRSRTGDNVVGSASAAALVSGTLEFVLSRRVLLETALAAGLSVLVAQYITSTGRGASTEGEDEGETLLLTDVKRVFEWAVDSPSTSNSSSSAPSQQSVLKALESALFFLCKGDVAALLLGKPNPASTHTQLTSQLQALLDVSAGLKMAVEALLERKLSALDGLGAGTATADYLDGSAVVVSVIEEGQRALRARILEIKCIMEVISVLLEVVAMSATSSLDFTSILSRQQSASSVYEGMRAARLRVEAHLNYLPEYLRSGDATLGDELVSMFQEQCGVNDATLFLRTSGTQAGRQGSDASTDTAVAEFFFLPLRALRTKLSSVLTINSSSNYQQSQGSGRSSVQIEQLEAHLVNASHIAHSIVLYVLLDMHFLSLQQHRSEKITSNGVVLSIKQFNKKLGGAMSVAQTVSQGVLALWQIDAGVNVSDAVRLICSTHTTIMADQRILIAVIKKLLTANHLAECKMLLNFLDSNRHSLVNSKLFVVATAAAISKADSWQVNYGFILSIL